MPYICLPVLYRSMWVAAFSMAKHQFMPPHIWPYVQTLRFTGEWMPLHPARCPSWYNPIPLADVLLQMPKLSQILVVCGDTGITWEGLITVLSFPRLRVFEAMNSAYQSEDSWSSKELTFAVPPLTSYTHFLRPYRFPPRHFVSDSRVLALVLRQPHVQRSLEVLAIPSEIISFDQLGTYEWPRLRTLKLEGELDPEPNAPLLPYLGRMPALEELHLRIARWTDNRTVFCAPDWEGPSPWPRLRNLSISYPDPDDAFYRHLPPSLLRLALRCWPRCYFHLVEHDRCTINHLGWRSPVLTASEMYRVLSRCGSPLLEQLDIEFVQDEADLDVFRLIPSAFPNLTTLTVCRYRRYGCYEVPVREIGEALSPLARLKVVYFHFDFKNMPHPFAVYNDTGTEEFELFRRTAEDSADTLARTLGANVEVVCILQREGLDNDWLPYRVSRSPEAACVRLDTTVGAETGIRESDEPGPMFFHRFPERYMIKDPR